MNRKASIKQGGVFQINKVYCAFCLNFPRANNYGGIVVLDSKDDEESV